MKTLVTIVSIFLPLVLPLPILADDVPQDDSAFPPAASPLVVVSLPPAPSDPAPFMEFISVAHIFFAFDKAELDERARHVLDQTARHVHHHNMTGMVSRIIIHGHTDEVGDTTYNYRLADRRAAVVRDYLIARGIAPGLLYSTGLGENSPIDESWTREGRRRNRHVEIYIVQTTPP